MTTDLTIVSNRATVTLPGSDGSTVYARISETNDTTLRRVQATSSSAPRTLAIIQQETNLGKRNAKRRTVVSVKEQDNTTLVPLEGSTTSGRADGECTLAISLNRPLGAGYQAFFTAAKVKTIFAVAADAFIQNIDAILAGER